MRRMGFYDVLRQNSIELVTGASDIEECGGS
jgi:hypothetical protein